MNNPVWREDRALIGAPSRRRLRQAGCVAVWPAALLAAALGSGWPCAAEPAAEGEPTRWALALHGGAGGLRPDMDPGLRAAYERVLGEVLRHGAELLTSGASSVDVVEAVIVRLEDEPLFNAGRGAALNLAGEAELDASIMEGATLDAGGVCLTRRTRNPIRAARAVMEHSDHVLLGGEGADAFARERGLESVDPAYFVTERRLAAVQRRREEAGLPPLGAFPPSSDESPGETVGCVALDRQGNLAAGTSTGGRTGKLVGRVGDSPVIGAGTFADNRSAAVSGTGRGEQFIRHSIAARVAWMVEAGATPDEAARVCLEQVLEPGDGGLIVLDRLGRVSMRMTTGSMPRGFADSSGMFETAILGGNP